MGEPQNNVQTPETPTAADTGGGASPPTHQGAHIKDAGVFLAEQAAAEKPPADPPPTPEAEVSPPPATPPVTAGDDTLDENTLKARLQRQESKILKDVYGTSDPDEIAKIKATQESSKKDHARLERMDRARRQAKLTNAERMTKAVEAKDERIKELEGQIQGAKTDASVEKQEVQINDSVNQHIKPSRVKYAKRELADHVKGLSPEKYAKFGPRQLDKFFQDFAKENPDFSAKVGEPEPAPAPKPKPRTRSVSTGNGGKKQKAAEPDGPGVFQGKTVKPGPHSMTKTELNEHYKAQGWKRAPY